jgi:hypothetical protein
MSPLRRLDKTAAETMPAERATFCFAIYRPHRSKKDAIVMIVLVWVSLAAA